MTQDESWQAKYDEVMGFIKTNHRNPSKFVGEERLLRNWVKHQRKLMNAGRLKPDRTIRFEELLVLIEQFRRKNQYE